MKSRPSRKYLCLVHFEIGKLLALNAAERATLDHDSLAYDRQLQQQGHFLAAQALESPSKAKIVSVRGKKIAVVDGPFAETKEQLGGFILVQASNMREAAKIAAGIPLAKLGWIEVRPIYTIPGSKDE